MTQVEIAPGTTRLGWIGTGVMGSSMCGHLMTRGFSVTVYSRTKSKTAAIAGSRRRSGPSSPRAVAHQSDVVFSMVGFPADVRQVVLGSRTARWRDCGRVASWST